ncbi:Stk1 family PASTA domain-containing Ser/Thr kinase [Leucobacter soli]|uniref:non-specific serine/threonine protein kinase n=1 Tax=Leucobacter soli TaxID=2812850 RepID=A0A916JX80_9MICO|nr:Stk1 family PASTA domain-containing Ser/Thr kinase [Leucobacter soli]CAG7607971.1 Serine/threonine-protein kinase PknB [Leucobacter soli]
MTETTATGGARMLAGRYSIGDYIGQGGMSTVYSGTDTKLGRKVAIKVMRANLAGDDQFRTRFRQEAQSASRLAHPSIVRVLDAGDDLIQTGEGPQRLPFIVMEYVDGQNLREIAAEERLSSAEACRVVDAVLSALEYSHRAGIVHRDIKPANIMITRGGQVKVMDFGIARAVSETSSTVQQTTAILGTAAYFSPEQAKGEPVDARTDLYSTGVLLYELLTGDVPFRGDTAVAVAYQHVSERPAPPSERDPSVTPELDRVILHALAKDRARRFQSASEFRDALRLAAGGVMPQLGAESEQTNVLFTAGDEGASESELALRRLSESGGATRSQSRPPVMWVWASILTVMAVIVAVVIWLMLLAPKTFTPSNTREVPALVNTEEAAALAALDELDLTGVVETEENDEIAEGLVIRTDPEAGARITTDMQVTLYVSSGPSGVEVPEFSLMSLKQYTAALEELGLEVGSVSKRNDPVEKKNAVLSVSPEVGTILDRGEAVELVVASGKVKIPDVTGQTVEAATQLLQPLRLAVNVVPDPNCPAAGATIIRQSLVGEQKRGSTVDIFYCSGLSGEED